MAAGLLSIHRVEKECPELFQWQACLFYLIKGVVDVVKDELVFAWRRAERQQRWLLIVLRFKEGLAGEAPGLLVQARLHQHVQTRLHEMIRVTRVPIS